jgi:hypothetical protein
MSLSKARLSTLLSNRTPRFLLAGVLALVALASLGLPRAATAEAAAPATQSFAAPVDGYAKYAAENTCSPTPKPGVVALRDKVLLPTYGGASWRFGMYRKCSAASSGHEEGRAMDWMMDATKPADYANAQAFLSWLLATDANGNKNAMARRLGIMYMMYNGKMWRAYDAAKGWQPQIYGGVDCAKLGSTYKTACHRDHIHMSFSWDGAYQRTSFWKPVAPAAAKRVAPAPVKTVITSPVGTSTKVARGGYITISGKAASRTGVKVYSRTVNGSYALRATVTAGSDGVWSHRRQVSASEFFYARGANGTKSSWIKVNV